MRKQFFLFFFLNQHWGEKLGSSAPLSRSVELFFPCFTTVECIEYCHIKVSMELQKFATMFHLVRMCLLFRVSTADSIRHSFQFSVQGIPQPKPQIASQTRTSAMYCICSVLRRFNGTHRNTANTSDRLFGCQSVTAFGKLLQPQNVSLCLRNFVWYMRAYSFLRRTWFDVCVCRMEALGNAFAMSDKDRAVSYCAATHIPLWHRIMQLKCLFFWPFSSAWSDK